MSLNTSSSSQISAQIDELEKSFKALSKAVAGDEHARKRLPVIVQEQATVLESSVEVMARMITEASSKQRMETKQGIANQSFTAASNCLFENSNGNALGGDNRFKYDSKTATELSSISKCDKQLMSVFHSS